MVMAMAEVSTTSVAMVSVEVSTASVEVASAVADTTLIAGLRIAIHIILQRQVQELLIKTCIMVQEEEERVTLQVLHQETEAFLLQEMYLEMRQRIELQLDLLQGMIRTQKM